MQRIYIEVDSALDRNLTEVLSTAMPLMMMPGREQIATSGFAVNGH
jgi:hypothetical protein